jgi:lipoyl(octanoyl) transferase
MIKQPLISKDLGRTDYRTTLAAMQLFTNHRNSQTTDEIWLTEHESVYTLGLNRKNVRLPQPTNAAHNIPLVLVDRGGKITYHGIGQSVIYLLIDIKRRNLNVRQFVNIIETSIIDLLKDFKINALTKKDAPGVYVFIDGYEKKIASLGLRLKNNCCYHGLSLNVDMDLTPFTQIDPCGYAGLQMTQTKDLGIAMSTQQMGENLLKLLAEKLNK